MSMVLKKALFSESNTLFFKNSVFLVFLINIYFFRQAVFYFKCDLVSSWFFQFWCNLIGQYFPVKDIDVCTLANRISFLKTFKTNTGFSVCFGVLKPQKHDLAPFLYLIPSRKVGSRKITTVFLWGRGLTRTVTYSMDIHSETFVYLYCSHLFSVISNFLSLYFSASLGID